MNIERWKEINDCFEYCLDLDEANREEYLNKIGADDEGLKLEVKSLLSYSELSMESFIEQLSYSHEDDSSAKWIGDYKLISELAQGGMGIVYLAESNQQLANRQVALKLLQKDSVTPNVLRRFKQECHILTQFQHQNIASVFDNGINEEGAPYLVLEYIDGQHINEYCDSHALSVVDRLRLFEDVCSAVAYAQERMVVHRDLKPSNIVVSKDRQVKLLDFGIAKILEEDRMDLSLPKTRTGAKLMTLRFASPEQVLSGKVTKATDVYALGVILYELLTGRSPYDLKDKSTYEIERLILETEPILPSNVITRAEILRNEKGAGVDLMDIICENRSTNTQQLRSQLRGDLDVIVMKALKKDPMRRYLSAAELKDDIVRFLAGKPIKARPENYFYKTSKFLSRHQVVFTSMLVFVLAAVVGTLISIQEIREERDIAEEALVKTQEVTEFIISVFKLSDGYKGRADSLTAREILDIGVSRVQEELNDQPEIQAEMLEVIGRVYNNLGMYEESVMQLKQSLKIRLNSSTANQLEIASSLYELGSTYWRDSDYESADSIFKQVVELRTTHLDKNHVLIAQAKNSLGNVLMDQGSYEKAIPNYEEALTIFSSHEDEKRPTATVLSNLGALYYYIGEYETSAGYHLRAINQRRMLPGNNNADIGTSLNNYAQVLNTIGEFEKAEIAQRECIDLWEKELGKSHPTIVVGKGNLAKIKISTEEYEVAERLLRESLEIAMSTLREDHVSTLITQTYLADVLRESDNLEESTSILRTAIPKLKTVLGDDHPHVARSIHSLAQSLEKLGANSDSEMRFKESLAKRQFTLRPNHPDIASSLNDLGAFLAKQGRHPEADSLLRQALAIRKDVFSERHWRIVEVMNALGKSYTAQQKFGEADSLLYTGYSYLLDSEAPPRSIVIESIKNLIDLYTALGDQKKLKEYREILTELSSQVV